MASISARFVLSSIQTSSLGARIPKLVWVCTGIVVAMLGVVLLQRLTEPMTLLGVILLTGFGDGLYVSPQPALLAQLFGVARLAPALSYWTLAQGVLTFGAYEAAARVVELDGAWRNAFLVSLATYAVSLLAAIVLGLSLVRASRRARAPVESQLTIASTVPYI